MARNGRIGASKTSGGRSKARGYTIRGKHGSIDYVGVTNNPARRAGEHSRDGKSGSLKVETRAMSRESARNWEARRLDTYRRNHRMNSPRFNRTRSGGWRS